MNNFETTLLITPDISSSKLKSIEKDFENLIKEMGGDIKGKEDWGLRDLSYKIKNAKKAFYYFFQIILESNKIQDIKKNLSLNEEIMRYLFIKVDKHENLPTIILKNSGKE